MARIKWWTYLLNEEGQIITGADVGIHLAGTSTPARIYTSETGLDTDINTYQLTTNADGYCEFWIGDSSDDNGYPSTQKFKIIWNKEGIANGWNDYISILPATIPVSLSEADDTKDKSISNNLAIGWEDHKNDNSYFVHGLQAVDKTDTNTAFNKLVSNATAKEWEDTKWVSWSNIDDDTTAVANRAYFIDGSSNTVTLLLPATPSIGDPVAVATIDVTETVSVDGNGNKIFGSTDPLEIPFAKSGFTLVYSGTDYGWTIVSQISGISPLDGDTVEIDFVPTYYTRDFSIAEASSLLHLSAHLAGIDNEINTINTDVLANANSIISVENDLTSHVIDFNDFSTIVTNHINDGDVHSSDPNAGVAVTYTHTQASPSTTWTIVHEIGSRNIVFEVYDGSYNRIVPQTAVLTDVDTLTLTFESATTGTCIIGGSTISNEAYDAVTWNGSVAAPTKNAVRDKIVQMDADFSFLSAGVDQNDSDISSLTTITNQLSTAIDNNSSDIITNIADINNLDLITNILDSKIYNNDNWHYGNGVPSSVLGLNGDYYLDVDSGDIYVKDVLVYSSTNTLSGGTATASSTASGSPDDVLDDNVGTNWTASTTSNEYWLYDLGAGNTRAYSKISIMPSNLGPSARLVRGYEVYGSINNRDWDLLTEGEIPAGSFSYVDLEFNNSINYRFLKFLVLSTYGTSISITEMKAYEIESASWQKVFDSSTDELISITNELSSAFDSANNSSLSDLSTNNSSMGSYINDIVGEDVNFKDVLYRNPANGKWYKANSISSVKMPVSAISVTNALSGDSCKMLETGYLRNDSWSFPLTGTKILYVSDVDGEITYNSGELTAGYIQPIGCVFASNIIKFFPSYTIDEII